MIVISFAALFSRNNERLPFKYILGPRRFFKYFVMCLVMSLSVLKLFVAVDEFLC